MKYLVELLTTAVDELFSVSAEPVLTRPEAQFGDFSTNVALQLAGKLQQQPRQIAEELKAYIEERHDGSIIQVDVAGPGFLNFTLGDETLWQQVGLHVQTSPEKILLEYSNPNAFKELHTGHLYQTILGDAISHLLEAEGAEVYRANFGGDVGLHVARCLWGIVQTLGGELPEKLADVPKDEQAAWISAAYVKGAKADTEDEKAKPEIAEINQAIYAFHQSDDHESPLAQIYWTCRDWSYDYMRRLYDQLQVKPFDKFYPESTTAEAGISLVKENTGTVFKESDGAIVFPGEDFDLHTRVFITSKGLPTYETKDLGVIQAEVADFPYDRRIVMTGNDQSEYMKVVFAALSQIDETLSKKQTHIANGTVKFGSGKKMSSRLGNVARAVDVLDVVREKVEAETDKLREAITLGAVKYAFLKQRIGGDIAFDVEESVSLQGNSGPYLQYAHARARSILAKKSCTEGPVANLNQDERSLVRALSMFTETIDQAVKDLMPHHICTYLYELSQTFNRFYEHNRVIDDEREAIRLQLVKAYADTLKQGLELLNITAPDKM